MGKRKKTTKHIHYHAPSNPSTSYFEFRRGGRIIQRSCHRSAAVVLFVHIGGSSSSRGGGTRSGIYSKRRERIAKIAATSTRSHGGRVSFRRRQKSRCQQTQGTGRRRPVESRRPHRNERSQGS